MSSKTRYILRSRENPRLILCTNDLFVSEAQVSPKGTDGIPTAKIFKSRASAAKVTLRFGIATIDEYKPQDAIGQYGVHTSHCCVRHGCKYGNDDCPVALRMAKQEYPCESCDDMGPMGRVIEALDNLLPEEVAFLGQELDPKNDASPPERCIRCSHIMLFHTRTSCRVPGCTCEDHD